MDHQKSANQQHLSHNLLCALVNSPYLSGPPLLGQHSGSKPQPVVPSPCASGSTEEGKAGPHRGLWPLPPITHQPKAALLLAFHIRSSGGLSFEEALVVQEPLRPHPDHCRGSAGSAGLLPITCSCAQTVWPSETETGPTSRTPPSRKPSLTLETQVEPPMATCMALSS